MTRLSYFILYLKHNSFSVGSAGPAFFGLGLRETLVTVTIVDILICAFPAFFAIFGPKMGMRAMVQARFSWGYFGAIIPSVLNVVSLQGFLILNCMIGGQTLASVSPHLNDNLGIIAIGMISLAITFCGYRVIHWYESVSWIPNIITLFVMLVVGGKHLIIIPGPAASASTLLSYSSIVTSSVLSWSTITPDYGVYHCGKASSLRIFIYTYSAFLSASIIPHFIGAAFAASSSAVPAWSVGFEGGENLGGLISAVLSPAGGFGKFLTALLALSISSASAPAMYSLGTSLMTIAPIFQKVPRYVYAFVSAAVLIPVAIIGATRFYTTIVGILGLIGYWSSAFVAIVLAEHFIFRHGRFDSYDINDWDKPRRLPLGVAATLAFLCAFGIMIPCMSQAFYEGPISKAGTGDIGMYTGGVIATIMFIILRIIEKKYEKS